MVSEDVLMISTAFRQACDEDTRLVLNTQSNPSIVGDLKFYLVPASWMRKAHPMLYASQTSNLGDAGDDDWREKVGPIQNAELLQWEHAVSSSSDDDEGDNQPKPGPPKRRQQPPPSCPLQRDLIHGRDYLLLGPNAWFLLREKFGHDNVVLERGCIAHRAEDSLLAAVVDKVPSAAEKNRLVSIPSGGRFPYEKLAVESYGPVANNQQQHQAPQQPTQGQPQQPDRNTSDVVSEDEEVNDLFPDDDPMGDTDKESSARLTSKSDPPVLMLGPSTTAAVSPVNGLSDAASNGLYPTIQEMDCAPDDENNDPLVGDGSAQVENEEITTTAVAVAALTTTWKIYGSGLSNLGNTCFMNSTLQCLAHTDPLRRYFLSGEYRKDLNRTNPLGTGGDLATEFAKLLAEMWGSTVPGDRRNVFPKHENTYISSAASGSVYPRDFKVTLGKHAEQFMGYDQHDSQELATYLLDALHEDTNRVTTKPYIEKPEQGEDEADDVAAKKAWDLHLKREDSKVMENFVGQVKSRVECSEPGCGRTSTTFDPFMYLSVPIPGSMDRTLRVTFVPLNGKERSQSVSVVVNKTATISKLLLKVAEKVNKSMGKQLQLEDLVAADIWSQKVYHWYAPEEDVDRIRDSDETYIFETLPAAEIKKLEEDCAVSEDVVTSIERVRESSRSSRFQLDLPTMTQLQRGNEWQHSIEGYVKQKTHVHFVFNPKRATTENRIDFYFKMVDFIDGCLRELDKAGNKRAREEDNNISQEEQQVSNSDSDRRVSTEEDEIPALVEKCSSSQSFAVKTRYDLAVMEFCASQLRREILNEGNVDKKKSAGGCDIEVISRNLHGHDKVAPLVLRIPASLTIYGLREELAKRFARSVKRELPMQNKSDPDLAEGNSQGSDVVPMEGDSDTGGGDGDGDTPAVESMNLSAESSSEVGGDPALLILRQVPLRYERKRGSVSTYSRNSGTAAIRMGAVEEEMTYDSTRPIPLASPTDEEEQLFVSDLVGTQGAVFLDWPTNLLERSFDSSEFGAIDDLPDPDGEAAAAMQRKQKQTTTVIDCIQKYCQMEQLEETEMWYCSRCKKHVRAWKQFHLYSTPPILIVHLKRFQYSASTHRRDKINTFIDFPLTDLDLSDQVMHWSEGQKPIYDCYAVSNHFGGLGGGHYTAYALNDDGVWCNYEDSRVTSHVDPKEVVSESAYVLYYRRKDVAVGYEYVFDGLEFETPAIVPDHSEKGGTPSEVSSSNAAQVGDEDMDVDATDAESHASSKTGSSPMGSIDGGENVYDGHLYSEHDESLLFPENNNDQQGSNYPLQ